MPPPLPVYEVYALKYAERDGRRPDHFVGGDPRDAPMPMDYFIWVIRNDERLVLVDTGFDAPIAAKRGRRLLGNWGQTRISATRSKFESDPNFLQFPPSSRRMRVTITSTSS